MVVGTDGGERPQISRRMLAAGAAVAALFGAGASSAQDKSSVQGGVDEVEAVVVTALKRPEPALAVPASMEVLSGQALVRTQVLNIENLGQVAPNVAVAQFGDGQYRLIYRGLGATGTSDNENFNVAYDGTIVPYGNAYRLLDLQQVEILRGPQGTLYGRNTNAGLINVVPRDGSVSAPTTADVFYGSFNTMGVSAATGGPLGDWGGFFRLAARGEQTDGYIDNRALRRSHTDQSKNGTVRATGGWEGGPWKFKVSLTYDRYLGDTDDLTPARTPYSSPAPDVGRSNGHLTMPIVTLSYKGDGYTFTSTTAFAEAARLLTFSSVVAPVLNGQFDRRDTLSQEFRFAGDANVLGRPTDWVTGLFLMNENDAFTSTLNLTHPANVSLVYQDQHENTRSAALFGEAVTSWSDHWKTTIGLRIADERQAYHYILSRTGALMASDQTYATVQPKFVLSYLPDRDSQAYASVTRGFRAGAVFVNNALQDPNNPSYKPENTWQYELGYKAQTDGGRLQWMADVFYIDWSDLQVQRSILSVSPAGVFSVVDNATRARSYGAEAEANWTPLNGLQVYAKAGYTNARYLDFHPTSALNYSGNRIEEVPESSLGMGFDYLSSTGLEVAGDVTRYGSMAYDAANSILQKPYTLLNASLAYNLRNWRVALSGHNLLDQRYANRGVTSGGQAYIHAAPPASAMVELSFRY
ncbi:MAG: TonB-dependent receptor [Caulobacteraceae bacterium]|nr:TonB-dependent receptor [Caulobacteraceae bacterium]